DLGGAATHEHDRLVACLLPEPEQHDLHKAADMEAVRSAIEADIGDGGSFKEVRVECLTVGDLMHETAGFGGGQKRGASEGHDYSGIDRRPRNDGARAVAHQRGCDNSRPCGSGAPALPKA